MTEVSSGTDTVVGSGTVHLRSRRWRPAHPRGAVLLVHGLGEHAGRYEHVGRAWAARGLSVLAYDQRGHGESEGRRGHLESFDVLVEDLHQVRTAAERGSGGRTPFLFGHSMGGLVLIRYLQRYRPRTPGAILSAPWLGTKVEVPRWKRLTARILERLAPELTLRSEVEPEELSGDPAMQRAYREDPLVHHRISAGLFDEVRSAQARALEQGIPPETPTLLLAPGADRVTDVELATAWADGLSGDDVSVWSLEGARHEPHNEVDRDDLLDRVADWIEDRLPPRESTEDPE